MNIRKSEDFYGHWIIEIEEQHPMFSETYWVPIGEYSNEHQADAVIKDMQDQEKFKPMYEFFNSGSQEPSINNIRNDIGDDITQEENVFLSGLDEKIKKDDNQEN